eukprot:CAMPEP_0185021146 /NCGR_PEP_ID=MMETSP1103-20130426/3812_1 /TAXON_ID=36769 /ORGANISM="Paraphysomonas bandaiensis, Strain Caron Lab Isolate" /LENGTH=483 /DNA_ID=CAMNT_0027552489 /DNA_START=68 /DNA_END=1519 /DNA_ORIENTATION=-
MALSVLSTPLQSSHVITLLFIYGCVCTYASSTETPNHSWQMEFSKMGAVNPVLGPNASSVFKCPVRRKNVRWEEKDVFNPAAVVKDNKVYLLYRAEDKLGSYAGTSRIGIAWSEDGVSFNNRLPSPVLYPAKDRNDKFEWDGGCEDPRVVESPDGGYVMTYTSYDGTARLCVATSSDLFHWTKHGPAFGKAFGGSYLNAWTKSGSIVSHPMPDGRLVAAKLNGSFWMYWGENDLHLATSQDLINWTPVMAEHADAVYRGRPDHMDLPTAAKKPLSVLSPRRGKFDSNLVEPGPPAIVRPDGILFIYNSKNTACESLPGYRCVNGEADPNLAPGTYSAGQVLFSLDDPSKVLMRSEETFFKPSEDFEITGQVGNVCFLEGLVFFRGKWLLYYGTADSKIAVAEASFYDHKGMPDRRAQARRERGRSSTETEPIDAEVFSRKAKSRGKSDRKVAEKQQQLRETDDKIEGNSTLIPVQLSESEDEL